MNLYKLQKIIQLIRNFRVVNIYSFTVGKSILIHTYGD